jgi:hypothetical protein
VKFVTPIAKPINVFDAPIDVRYIGSMKNAELPNIKKKKAVKSMPKFKAI